LGPYFDTRGGQSSRDHRREKQKIAHDSTPVKISGPLAVFVPPAERASAPINVTPKYPTRR